MHARIRRGAVTSRRTRGPYIVDLAASWAVEIHIEMPGELCSHEGDLRKCQLVCWHDDSRRREE